MLKIKMIDMKYILSTDALLYCARSTDAYKATLFDVELILHGGWISKWMSRILCAHCTAYKGIRKQCKWVLSTDIVQNNTTYPNKVVKGEMFVVMVMLLRMRRGGEFDITIITFDLIHFWKEWQCCKLCSIPAAFCFCQAMHPVLITPRDCNPKNLDFNQSRSLFSRFCHLMSDIASDLVLFLPSNAFGISTPKI